jgi:uncharacterized protein YgbK (DUF1537 family)
MPMTAARSRILVVADDLTGANAVGAAFRRTGRRAVAVSAAHRGRIAARSWNGFDVVAVNTGSRHVSPPEAAEGVAAVVRDWWPADLVSKRIDTTLRGNLGAEVAAAISACAAMSDAVTVGLAVPAHPRAGRTTVDGRQLLHGQPVDGTETARDVRTPIATADVAAAIRHGTDLRTAHVRSPSRGGGSDPLREALRDAVANGVDVIVCDAESDVDIQLIAQGAADVLADVPTMRWLAVDPGPFTVELALALRIPAMRTSHPVLAISGSATELTRHQLRRLIAERHPHVVRVPCDAGHPPDVDATTAALSAALTEAAAGDVVLLASAIADEDVADVADGADELAACIALIARGAMERSAISGLYVSGGDVAAAVLAELEGCGMEVTHELAPLTVSGSVVGGPWHSLPVVTKGGLVGDDDALIACVDHLRADLPRLESRP